MAKKGQEFRRYTKQEQNEILEKSLCGISSLALERRYGVSANTIRMWKYKSNHPELRTGNKRGRQKEKDLTKEDYMERYEIIKKYQAFLKVQRERK